MRNCFTKITNVFRKKSTATAPIQQLECNHLNAIDDGNEETTTTNANHASCQPRADNKKKKKKGQQKQGNRKQNDADIEEYDAIRFNEAIDKGNTSPPITGDGDDKKSSSLRTKQSSSKKKELKHVLQQMTVGNVVAEAGNLEGSNAARENNDGTENTEFVEKTKESKNYVRTTNSKTKLSDSENCYHENGTEKANDNEQSVIKNFENSTSAKTTTMTTTAAVDTPHGYIDEYKTFVEQQNFIGTPYITSDRDSFKRFEEAFNLSTLKQRGVFKAASSSRGSLMVSSTKSMSTTSAALIGGSDNNGNPLKANANNFIPQSPSANSSLVAAKTPEEIEYEATVAAESKDMMTPLPPSTSTFTLCGGGGGRGTNLHHPEMVEVIRNLDANALRINNLTLEDKVELMRRFDSQQQQQHHHHHHQNQHHHQHKLRNDSNNKPPLLLAIENYARQSENVERNSPESESGSDSGDVAMVELRRKVMVANKQCLFERRQPKVAKLKLSVKALSKDGAAAADDDDRTSDYWEKILMDVKFPNVLPPNPQLKALLVFHKTDNICEVLTEACHRQQLDVTVARTKEGALETLSNTGATAEFYHLIIIDARSSKHLDAEYISRSIRHTNGHHFTTIIAVVKKSFFEKDDFLIALLDAGVNRCIPETTNLSTCSIELKQILHSIVRPHNVMSTQQALYTALHRLKEVLIITDHLLRIQYANRAAERLLNMRLDEIISKPLGDIFISDVSSITTLVKKNKEFDEILTVRRKSQEGISMHVRVVPVACIGRTPTHLVFNFDVPGAHGDFVATLPQPREAPRGSLHSIRRGSCDVRSVASDGLRRTSLAKLTSLPLEAPITKIINLLSQVQENCSSDEARLIDKVLEFLKREGLYSPQMKEMRTDDPIATDLIGALLTGPSLYSSRRSSNDSIIRVGSRQSGIMPAKMKATPHIMELLEESLSWEFDIFKLETITEKRPLLYLGMEMFRRFDVFSTLNIDESICKGWFAVIESQYHAKNTYHNSTHAADVMQATGAFITQLATKQMVMDRIDEATVLIAAAAHDVDHPGRSSAFLCNSNSQLALLYNDLTVLESHHAATTFRLTLGDDKINIFKNLDKDTYKSVRSIIIDMILATEMTRHFEHLAKFVSVFGTDEEPRDIVQTEEDSSILIRRMLIKVADVSNPARPPAYCVEWSRRIAEEYFMQTDEEKSRALPIVMPMFDRATCSIPKSQIGFIEYIIQDMMHAWDSFIDMPQLITYMQINYSQWKKFEEQGIQTLADIKTKQATMSSKKNAK